MIHKRNGKILVAAGGLCSNCCYGVDCDACEPALWANGQTPKYVTITFAGITGCNGASVPDGAYELEQDPVPNPCTFSVISGDFNILWTPSDPSFGMSLARVYNVALDEAFFYDILAACQVSFNNDYVEADCDTGDPYTIKGYGGTAEVTW